MCSGFFSFLFLIFTGVGKWKLVTESESALLCQLQQKNPAVRWPQKAEYLPDTFWDPHSHFQLLKASYVCIWAGGIPEKGHGDGARPPRNTDKTAEGGQRKEIRVWKMWTSEVWSGEKVWKGLKSHLSGKRYYSTVTFSPFHHSVHSTETFCLITFLPWIAPKLMIV